MPHRVSGRKLGRPHAHRLRMLENLAVAVLRYERVQTTEAKAKEVRAIVDRYIGLAKRGDLSARRRLVAEMPNEPLIVDKLMGELAEKYADRSSGYTRIVKLGQRLGAPPERDHEVESLVLVIDLVGELALAPAVHAGDLAATLGEDLRDAVHDAFQGALGVPVHDDHDLVLRHATSFGLCGPAGEQGWSAAQSSTSCRDPDPTTEG